MLLLWSLMVLVVILFLKEVYGYLFYESYPATITSYVEYNVTNKDEDEIIEEDE